MNYFKKNLLRYILQWGVLAAIIFSFFKVFGNKTFDSEAYCPFGGLQTLTTYFSRGSMACSMTMLQIMMGVALAVGVILFGKLFCSYLCPLGLVNEVFVKIRRRLKIKQFVINRGSVLDKCFRLIKYLLLFVIFYFALSSSELFCKNFCPYYACATGFNGELTVWMVSISIGILIIGGMLVDMFWCKYVCPLGALSNIFRFTVMFIAVVLVQWILFMVGVNVPWIVFIGVIAVLGYIIEIKFGKAEYNVSLLHVHNNIERCNGCKNCVKRCPYHIEINKVKRVVDIDCNLCGECVSACNRNALKMGICNTRPDQNEIRGKWIPPLVTIILFVGAMYLGNKIELPTIDVKWLKEGVTESQLSSMEITELYSVKCYGSSMVLKDQLQKIKGVYGVKTFVKNGKAIVYYLNNETNEEIIREGINKANIRCK